jgi:hypothetical protein
LLAGPNDGLRVVTVIKPMPIVSPEAQIPYRRTSRRRAAPKRSVP